MVPHSPHPTPYPRSVVQDLQESSRLSKPWGRSQCFSMVCASVLASGFLPQLLFMADNRPQVEINLPPPPHPPKLILIMIFTTATGSQLTHTAFVSPSWDKWGVIHPITQLCGWLLARSLLLSTLRMRPDPDVWNSCSGQVGQMNKRIRSGGDGSVTKSTCYKSWV